MGSQLPGRLAAGTSAAALSCASLIGASLALLCKGVMRLRRSARFARMLLLPLLVLQAGGLPVADAQGPSIQPAPAQGGRATPSRQVGQQAATAIVRGATEPHRAAQPQTPQLAFASDRSGRLQIWKVDPVA